MSDYSVTNYNPNNAYDTLYVRQNQNVVAYDTLPQQTTRTNYVPKVSLETPPDTFELSAESKIKKNKEKSMPTWLKGVLWVGGTAAAAYGIVVGHRALNKPSLEKVAKNFSEIFRKNISNEEAQKMVSSYKEIFKTDNVDDFCKKIFEQVKKDYGYENSDIVLEIHKLKDNTTVKDLGAWVTGQGTMELYPVVTDVGKISLENRKTLFGAIIHEFQHVKQTEYAYRTNMEKLAEAIFKNEFKGEDTITKLKEILDNSIKLKKVAEHWKESEENTRQKLQELLNKAKNGEEVVLHMNSNINTIKTSLNRVFGSFEQFAKDSDNYKQGLRYIDNKKNYIRPEKDRKGYMEQLIENEAYTAEDKSKEIANSFESIWRVF